MAADPEKGSIAKEVSDHLGDAEELSELHLRARRWQVFGGGESRSRVELGRLIRVQAVAMNDSLASSSQLELGVRRENITFDGCRSGRLYPADHGLE
jgi:hypothetical protein